MVQSIYISIIYQGENIMKKILIFLVVYLITLPIIISAAPTNKVDTSLNPTTLNLLKDQKPVLVDVDKDGSFSTVKVYFDGKAVTLNSRPFTYKGRIYLPLRDVGEILGTNIGWNTPYKVAIVETSTKRLEMPQGYRKAISFSKSTPSKATTVSVDQTSLDVRTILYLGKTYLPIRFTAESLGINVKYEEASSSVYFTTQ